MDSVARNTVHGWPSSLLNEPGGATTSPSGASTAASRSLVEVLPDEPVMPTMVSPPSTSSAATAAASRASAASTAAPAPSVSCSSTLAAAWILSSGALGLTTIAGTPTGRAASTADGARAHRGRGEIVAVRACARQRQEEPARCHGPRIEFDRARDAGSGRVVRRDVGQLTADDVGDLGDGQIDHARCLRRLERLSEFVAIVEGPGLPAAGLAGFVALTRDQHHVARLCPCDRVVDGLATVTDLDDLRPAARRARP